MARLNDRQKKQIMADRVDGMSIRQLAKKYGTSSTTVQRILKSNPEVERLVTQKKNENTDAIMAYMERKRDTVCDIIGTGLSVLPEKIANAKTASEVTTALGTLIDKWTAISGGPADTAKEDDLSRSLKELGKELESDV